MIRYPLSNVKLFGPASIHQYWAKSWQMESQFYRDTSWRQHVLAAQFCY